jgi:hypothetical protein
LRTTCSKASLSASLKRVSNCLLIQPFRFNVAAHAAESRIRTHETPAQVKNSKNLYQSTYSVREIASVLGRSSVGHCS